MAILVNEDHAWAEGDINTTYRLCDKEDLDKFRKMDTKNVLNDESFSLDLGLKMEECRMDQPEPNAIDYDTWRKGMEIRIALYLHALVSLRSAALLQGGSS